MSICGSLDQGLPIRPRDDQRRVRSFRFRMVHHTPPLRRNSCSQLDDRSFSRLPTELTFWVLRFHVENLRKFMRILVDR